MEKIILGRNDIQQYVEMHMPVKKITNIVIHCSATKVGQKVDVDVIDNWHKSRFLCQPASGRFCGYHFVIPENGEIQVGRFLNETGAHVAGQNTGKIGICYCGGLDENGKGKDTRNEAQKNALLCLLNFLLVYFPDAKIKGHRDYSPDLNGNGIIEPFEYMKECPCFNAIDEYKVI